MKDTEGRAGREKRQKAKRQEAEQVKDREREESVRGVNQRLQVGGYCVCVCVCVCVCLCVCTGLTVSQGYISGH